MSLCNVIFTIHCMRYYPKKIVTDLGFLELLKDKNTNQKGRIYVRTPTVKTI